MNNNIEEDIKKLKRMNFRLFSSFRTIIDILNERERDELLNCQVYHIMKEIDYDDKYELLNKIGDELKQLKEEHIQLRNTVYELSGKLNYLQSKTEPKYYEFSDNETTEEDDTICGCGKPPQQPCPEIEDYINSITQIQ